MKFLIRAHEAAYLPDFGLGSDTFKGCCDLIFSVLNLVFLSKKTGFPFE